MITNRALWLLAVALGLLVLQGRKREPSRGEFEKGLQETVEAVATPLTRALFGIGEAAGQGFRDLFVGQPLTVDQVPAVEAPR